MLADGAGIIKNDTEVRNPVALNAKLSIAHTQHTHVQVEMSGDVVHVCAPGHILSIRLGDCLLDLREGIEKV